MRDRSASGIEGEWDRGLRDRSAIGIGGECNLGMRGWEREWDRSQMGLGLSEIQVRVRAEAHGIVGCGNLSQLGAQADRVVFGYTAGSVPCVAFSGV